MERNDEKYFGRIIAIDYLKAIASILVILTHALSKNQRLKIGGPFWISMAVPIFMIISGFTNTLSAEKAGLDSFKEFYKKEGLFREFSRILSPYFIIISLEFILGLFQLFILETGPFISFTMNDYLLYFLTGGTTPGSYYIPILIQFVIVFPLMFILFKKSVSKSILFFLSIHFLFDLMANYLPISTKIYRLSIFRYFAFIIFGIALYHCYNKLRKSMKWLSLISISYISAYALGYQLKIFAKWPNTALPTVFWALTLVIVGMEYLEKEPNNRLMYLFNRIGKASYHIFLVQKVLFGFGLNKFFKWMNLNTITTSIFAIVISCFLGLLFYRVEFEKSLK